jgi:hypothetical protein
MRRTFQDLGRSAKIADLIVRAISGHATETMQRHYSTVADHEVRDALKRIFDLVVGNMLDDVRAEVDEKEPKLDEKPIAVDEKRDQLHEQEPKLDEKQPPADETPTKQEEPDSSDPSSRREE